MSNPKCRAKDPTKCWKHGDQHGIIADEHIRRAMGNPDFRYYLTAEQRTETPLKKLTATGLTLAILDYVKTRPDIDELKIKNAILLASRLHREDLRSNRGRYDKTAYIEHPLRNALRGIRYGASSETIIIGSLFHDTVEDHPFELAEEFYGQKTDDEATAREYSYIYIQNTYGKPVKDMVEGMSNPIIANKYTPAAEKNRIYAQHVEEAIEDPDVCVGKVCDFVDNAVGLFHNEKGTMNPVGLKKRATKYLPVCDILQARLERAKTEPNFPVDHAGIDHMLKHIDDGRRSLQRLAGV